MAEPEAAEGRGVDADRAYSISRGMDALGEPSFFYFRTQPQFLDLDALSPANRRGAGQRVMLEVDDVGREARAALAVDRLVPLVLGERLRLACDQIAQRAAACKTGRSPRRRAVSAVIESGIRVGLALFRTCRAAATSVCTL